MWRLCLNAEMISSFSQKILPQVGILIGSSYLKIVIPLEATVKIITKD
jgi:hypothetical protein